jgi:hypothetical protein
MVFIAMLVRSRPVTIRDLEGVYKAVAQGLAAIRG